MEENKELKTILDEAVGKFNMDRNDKLGINIYYEGDVKFLEIIYKGKNLLSISTVQQDAYYKIIRFCLCLTFEQTIEKYKL